MRDERKIKCVMQRKPHASADVSFYWILPNEVKVPFVDVMQGQHHVLVVVKISPIPLTSRFHV